MCKYLGHLPSSAWREPAHFQRVSPRHELDRVRYSAMLEYDAKAPGILHSEKVSTRGCVAGTANQTLRAAMRPSAATHLSVNNVHEALDQASVPSRQRHDAL